MGMFDALEDLGGEVGDALSDLGVTDTQDGNNLDLATRAIQSAIEASGVGVPLPRPRFLMGPPDTSKIPTEQSTWEDALKQAGHVVDNFLYPAIGQGAGPGYGNLGAALLTNSAHKHGLGNASPYEQPIHLVDAFRVEEGLNRLWRAFVTLRKPTSAYNPPVAAPKDWENIVEKAFTDDGADGYWQDAGGGPFGLPNPQIDPTDRAEWDRMTDLVNDAMPGAGNRPNSPTLAGELWDAQDPDAIDRTKLPPDHKGANRCTPESYIGQFARLCVARRFATSKFTLNERWFTGVIEAFEDLGVDSARPMYRLMRVTLRPRLFQLSLRKRFRVFKNMNAPEIAIALLKEHGIYEKDAGNDALTSLRVAPGGKELWGPIGIPDAAMGAVDKVTQAVDGMVEEFGGDAPIGGAVSDVLAQSIEDWRPKREYCVQYGETDLELFERLLAEEGLTFFFEHRERQETLVICEDPRLAGKKVLTAARVAVPYFSDSQLPTNTARYGEFGWDVGVYRKPAVSGVTLRDRTYARPYDPTDLKAGEALDLLSPNGLAAMTSSGGLEQMANQVMGLATELVGTPGTEDYAGPEAQWFEWPANVEHPKAADDDPLAYEAYGGPPMAQLRHEAFRSQGAICRGGSECATLSPGGNVTLLGPFDVLQPGVQKPQRFLVLSVVHEGTRGVPNKLANPSVPPPPAPTAGQTAAEDFDLAYANTFEALNIAIPYRPPPAAPRKIAGVQTAIVIDAENKEEPKSASEVYVTEKQSAWRVRVRFPWERGDAVDGGVGKASESWGTHWLRFAQPFSGAGFGAQFVPRSGMEVIVGFEEGNPDRPYVLGALYNAKHKAAIGTRHAANPNVAPKQDDGTDPGLINGHAARMLDSGFTSRSWPDDNLGEGFEGNEVRFEDVPKNERIRIAAKRDLAEEAGLDHVTTVVKRQDNVVTMNHHELVWGDQQLHARYESKGDNDWGRHVKVAGDETIAIGGGSSERPPYAKEEEEEEETKTGFLMRDIVEKDDSLKVAESRTVTIKEDELLTIKGDESSADNPGRLLRIGANSTVNIDKNDEFTVTGDRRTVVKQAHTITAAQISMKTRGPADAGGRSEPTGGVSITDEGIEMTSSGDLNMEAPLGFTAESTADRVLVKAKKKITISSTTGDMFFTLDGERKVIGIKAKGGTKVLLDCDPSALELKKDAINLVNGESKWATSTAADGAYSEVDGPTVTLSAEDKIHLNATQPITIGQPTSSTVK